MGDLLRLFQAYYVMKNPSAGVEVSDEEYGDLMSNLRSLSLPDVRV